MNNEQKIWFVFSIICDIAFVTLLVTSLYGKRFEYEFYVIVLLFGSLYAGMLMFAMTQYLTTKEIFLILMEKTGIKRFFIKDGDKNE